MEEPEILIAIKEGHLNTFEMIFKKYCAPLVAYSSTILKNRDEAEDIVQQVFVTVWNKRQEADKIQSLKSYLYRSVYNASLNRIRQVNVRDEYAKDYQFRRSSDAYQKESDHKELQQRIEKAIDTLPEQCGKIFRLSRFDQLKYSEIAEKLGISVKTVENQMGKALKLMREALADYLPLLIFFITNYFE